MPVLAPRAIEVAGEGSRGEGDRHGVEMAERLLLDGIARKRGDQPVDERIERAVAVLPRVAPAHLAAGQVRSAARRSGSEPPS